MNTGTIKAILLTGLLTLCSSQAEAITVDGNASDWFNNTAGGYATWTASGEVTKFVNHDGVYVTIPETANWDNTDYDIEFGAFSAQDNGLYVMMVLSDKNVWEDLAIAVDGSATHQFGVDLSGLDDQKNVVQNRNVYDVSSWQTTHSKYTGLPEFNILGGDITGQAQFVFSSLGHGDTNKNDYVVEGFLSWASIGGRPEEICLQYSEISCLRDSLGTSLCGSTAVPEPASMMLLGTGLLGAVVRRRRNKNVA